jgi:hypothetical protein
MTDETDQLAPTMRADHCSYVEGGRLYLVELQEKYVQIYYPVLP